MPALTHADMVAVIEAGGSVLYNGRTIRTVAELPTDEELAGPPTAADTSVAWSFDLQLGKFIQQRTIESTT